MYGNSSVNLNDLVNYSKYFLTGSASVNQPASDWGFITNLHMNDITNDRLFQKYLCDDGLKVYLRSRAGGSWGDWHLQEAIVASSSGYNCYIKYASGLILQWGKTSVTASNYNYVKTVNLPIKFTTLEYSVSLSSYHDGSLGTYPQMIISEINTAYFKIKSNMEVSNTVEWIAIGH